MEKNEGPFGTPNLNNGHPKIKKAPLEVPQDRDFVVFWMVPALRDRRNAGVIKKYFAPMGVEISEKTALKGIFPSLRQI